MRGWGKIVKIQNQWQGQYQSKQTVKNIKKLLTTSQQKLSNILSLYENRKNNQKKNQKQNTLKILANIQKLIQSRFLAQKYPFSVNSNKKKQNLQYIGQKRIIPYIPEKKIQQCFRIIQSQQTQKLSLVDKYAMIDPENQKNNDKSLYTLNLYNVEPSLGTKQQLVAEVIVFLLKWERQSIQQKSMFSKLLQSLIIHCLQFCQIDVLQPEIYIQLLNQYMPNMNSRQYSLNKDNSLFIDFLVNYPNLRKIVNNSNNNNINDQISGKKRKFLQKKQYYIDKSQDLTQNQKYLISKQYLSFNLNYQVQQRYLSQQHVNQDPLYRKFALQQKNITLLRQVQPTSKKQKNGIYVEFQKRITQNQQQLINKIKGQVDKFNIRKDDKILYETGLQKDLWYRKVKQEKVNISTMNKQSKVTDAINKQIGKFKNFIQQSNKTIQQK